MINKIYKYILLCISLATYISQYQCETYPLIDLKNIELKGKELSLSGVSSGGYMSGQYHIAYSQDVVGVGIIAGGPYWCAMDDISVALTSCMRTPKLIDIDALVRITDDTYTTTKTIDNPLYIDGDKVYIYSGTLDTVVDPGVVNKTYEYYLNYISDPDINIKTVFDLPSEHAFITNYYGNECDYFGEPYINNCMYDATGDLLSHIYDDIKIPNDISTYDESNLYSFDQTQYFPFEQTTTTISMQKEGYIYIPDECMNSDIECKVHISFHGCLMTVDDIGYQYITSTGYNSYSELNNIILIYPQVKTNKIKNPNGCWDWWGYTNSAYASQDGPQMKTIKNILDDIMV